MTNEQKQSREFIPLPQWWSWEELEVFKRAGGGWDGIEAVIEFNERNFYGE